MNKRDLERLEELALLTADMLRRERAKQGKCQCPRGILTLKGCIHYCKEGNCSMLSSSL